MGGPGSGNWGGIGGKGKAEECRRLDIREIRKRGCLYPGAQRLMSWSIGGEPCGSISYRVERDRINLSFRYREYEGDWEEVAQTVLFDTTPCNYGGVRKWFRCPRHGCAKRVAVLYGVGKYFLCRHCYDLAYSSQYEAVWDRASRKSRKYLQRLGGDPYDEEYPEKPKGMHWRTYNAILDKAEYYDDLSWRLIGFLGQ